MIWEKMLYSENIWRKNRYVRFTDIIVLYTKMKIACLVSQLIVTKLVPNPENNRIFLKWNSMAVWRWERDI